MSRQEELILRKAIHGLNAESYGLNKNIIQKSATMNDIPLNETIYNPTPLTQQPGLGPGSLPVPPPQIGNVQAAPLPQITGDPALLNNLIERVSSVEKQITKFVNLIERRIAKNAKEINIRIKLDNDSTNTE